MRSRHVLVPLLAPAALVLMTGCGSSTTSASAPPATAPPSATPATATASGGPQTLALIERPTSTTFTPKGGTATQGSPTRQPASGDVVAFDSALSRAGAPFGHDHVSFTYRDGGLALVDATLALPDGTLVVRGTVPLSESLTIPVVSGTGAYSARGGSLTAKHLSGQEDQLTITLR
jgi:hypothetical protein